MKRNLSDPAIVCSLFLVSMALYAATCPGNHGDAEDAHVYATWLKPGRANYALWDPHHNLYLPVTKLTFDAVRRIVPGMQPFAWLTAVSMVCGALSIAGIYIFARRCMRSSRTHSTAISLLLLSSYGFWRYSCTPEIYTSATLLALVTLYLVFRCDRGPLNCVWAGIAGAAAIGLHVGNLPAVGILGFVYIWRRKGPRNALIYATIVVVLTASHYGLPAFLPKRARSLPEFVKAGALLERACTPAGAAALPRPAHLLKGALCFPQAWIAPNFLLGTPEFRTWLLREFAHRNMAEEFFLGEAVQGDPLLPAAWVTLCLFALALVLVCVSLVRKRAALRSATGHGINTWLFAWFALNTGMVLLKEPDNPELWIFPFVPFALWTGGMLVRVLPGAMCTAHFASLIILALAHNWLGGMRVLADRTTDLNMQIADAVTAVAREHDIVLTARGGICRSYLEYYAESHVVDVQRLLRTRDFALPESQTHYRIYATGDIFEPPPYLRNVAPRLYRRLEDWGRRYRASFKPVAGNDAVVVYVYGGGPDPVSDSPAEPEDAP